MWPHVLIGKRITVREATNNDLINISGEVVDETKETLVVETGEGKKTLLKHQVTLDVEGTMVEGEDLVARPEDRVKG